MTELHEIHNADKLMIAQQIENLIERYEFQIGKKPETINITQSQFEQLKTELKDIAVFKHNNNDGFNYYNSVKLIVSN